MIFSLLIKYMILITKLTPMGIAVASFLLLQKRMEQQKDTADSPTPIEIGGTPKKQSVKIQTGYKATPLKINVHFSDDLSRPYRYGISLFLISCATNGI